MRSLVPPNSLTLGAPHLLPPAHTRWMGRHLGPNPLAPGGGREITIKCIVSTSVYLKCVFLHLQNKVLGNIHLMLGIIAGTEFSLSSLRSTFITDD